jgi:hypothetical protein
MQLSVKYVNLTVLRSCSQVCAIDGESHRICIEQLLRTFSMHILCEDHLQ